MSLYGHVLYIGIYVSILSTRSETRVEEKPEVAQSNQGICIGRRVQMLWHKAHLERCLQTFYVIMIQVYVL